MNKLVWAIWVVACIRLACVFIRYVLSDQKIDYLIGEATRRHHQIDMACTSCHTDSFGSTEVIQKACLNFYQDGLATSNDSHTKKPQD